MQRIDKRSTAFRLLCLCLITVAGIVVGCGKAIEAPRGTAVLGLSAHFVDARQRPIDDPGDPAYSKSHLKIQGQAYKDGVPIKQGAVDVTVVSNTYKFNQSMFLPLDEHGNFASPVDAFTSIHPGSEVAITADLASGDAHESHSKIDIDSESPTKKWVAVLGIPAVLLGMLVIFLYAFTGPTDRVKNRLAIQFSYVVILLFLAVPIVSPVLLLRLFPSAVDGMIGYPAGLVVTRIGEPPHASAQWAINIGGYSHVCVDLCLDAGTLAQQAAEDKAKAAEQAAAAKGNSKPPGGAGVASTPKAADQTPRTPSNAPSTGSPGSAAPAPTAGAAQPTPATSQAAAPPGVAAAKIPAVHNSAAEDATDTEDSSKGTIASRDSSAQAQPNPGDDLIHPERLDPPIVKVEGGLVIPLYVIVLSVIGGAINMTRKVPAFQREGESGTSAKAAAKDEAEKQDEKDKAAVAAQALDQDAAAPKAPAADTVSLEDQAAAIDHALDDMMPAQITRNVETAITVPKMQELVAQMQSLFASCTSPTLRTYRNFDEWYVSRPRLREILGGSWRVELLNQYMYLISAPFLAIVTYYILDLLGLSKPGVVVVLSFSVGLISEKIVSWILGIAAGYMQTPKT